MTIYEDENILAVNKPAGIAVHPDTKYKAGTLIQEILKTHPEIKGVGDSKESAELRPGLVHRLDKDTSGVLVIAKNQKTFEFLKSQFAERKIKKTYIALVTGKLNPKDGGNTGTIDTPIGRSKESPLKRLSGKNLKGKTREALTEYKILKRFSLPDKKNYTLLEVYPKTGRTHQIRVHLKSIGHPVVCDKLYSKKPDCPFNLGRQFLHAASLEISAPDGSRLQLEADLPDELSQVLKSLEECDKKEQCNFHQ